MRIIVDGVNNRPRAPEPGPVGPVHSFAQSSMAGVALAAFVVAAFLWLTGMLP